MAIFKKSQPKTKNQEVKEEVKVPAKPESKVTPRSSALLVRQAWITEKAGLLSNSRKYVFIVNQKANKPEVRKAIESLYSVHITDVNIVNVKGAAKRLGRSVGRSENYKKAIVSLKEGEKIDIMPH